MLTSADEVEAWRASQRAEAEAGHLSPQAIERVLADILIPSTRPPIQGIVVDSERRVFVSGPDLGATTEGWRRYRVFSPGGELLGVADFPPIFILDLDPDYVLGVSRDEDGVEFVVLHEVRGAIRP